MTPLGALALVTPWFDPEGVDRISRIRGGSVNETFRVDVRPRSYALRRLGREAPRESIEWELRLVDGLAAGLPYVAPPLVTRRGERFAELAGRFGTLTRWIDGDSFRSSGSSDPAVPTALARLHDQARKLPLHSARPDWPAWSDIDWYENQHWRWPPGDESAFTIDETDRIERNISWAGEILADFSALAWPRQPIHGDFGPANLLQSEGRLSAIIDFDECRLDWRVCDVADAIWSFCEDRRAAKLDVAAARQFLHRYESSNDPLSREERAAIPALIRVRRLWEALAIGLGNAQQGLTADHDYLKRNLSAVASMEDATDDAFEA